MTNITKIRNKSFHGTKENTDDVKKGYADAVEALFYIDEMIIDFLMKKSYQDKSDGYILIYGKE